MKYVYILQSEVQPDRFYVGSTADLQRRLEEHNAGNSVHTNKFKPWKVKTYLAFEDHGKADAFDTFFENRQWPGICKKAFIDSF